MSVLVDSCVWSLALRRKAGSIRSPEEHRLITEFDDAIDAGEVMIIGPIRQEILSGIRDSAQYERLRSYLAFFPDAVITTSDYERAALQFNLCRSHGIQCGQIDILICAVAGRCNWSILTSDKGMKHCLAVLNSQNGHG